MSDWAHYLEAAKATSQVSSRAKTSPYLEPLSSLSLSLSFFTLFCTSFCVQPRAGGLWTHRGSNPAPLELGDCGYTEGQTQPPVLEELTDWDQSGVREWGDPQIKTVLF